MVKTKHTKITDQNFWKNKKVLITGHTGFKGSWLTLWLQNLGAQICGISLEPNTNPSLFNSLELSKNIEHNICDIRDLEKLNNIFAKFQPEIVFHLAAQPLVRYSYHNPIETYQTNVIGTINVLEAIKKTNSTLATIIVTSDKCYENIEQIWGYRENDKMGGHDPYSNSKGCAELVVSAYTKSYFIPNQNYGKIASVRAGNVIGGGDWAEDRLIPDLIKTLVENKNPIIRSPKAIRPWQHVLEPLAGYMLVAEYLWNLPKQTTLLNWNFGPEQESQRDVEFVASKVCELWGGNNKTEIQENKNNLHEANLLYLDCTKVKKDLNWQPKWDINDTLFNTVEWYKSFYDKSDIAELSLKFLAKYNNL